MKKIFKIILIVLILILVILFLFLRFGTLSKKPACQISGGKLIMFQDGCGDSCIKVRETPDNPIYCTTALQENCDCGPTKCWNNEEQRCELNAY